MSILRIFVTLFYRKIVSLFEQLTSKPRIGGFAISESALQYVSVENPIRTYALRIPPGVIVEGKIIDLNAAKSIMQEFRRIVDVHEEVPLKVIITLPSSLVYTQSFSVPNLSEEKFRESVDLNLQMLSPMPKEEAYMSGEVLTIFQDRIELLGAFAEKKHIDMYRDLCMEAGFTPLAFEFPGRSLARLVQSVIGVIQYPLLVFSVSSDGLNLMIIKNGSLYFDYFRTWHSIQGSAEEISQSVFENVVVHEIQKVIHFSLSHFKETPERIFLIAPGLEENIQKFLKEHFTLPIIPLTTPSWDIAPQLYTALGSALRGVMDRSEDRAVSVAPQGSLQIFYKEQTLRFIHMWRNISVSVLSFFLVIFGFSAYFLTKQVSLFKNEFQNTRDASKNDLVAMMNRASEFNVLVRTVSDGQRAQKSWNILLRRIEDIMSREYITLHRVEIGGLHNIITLVAYAPDYDAVVNFKTAMSLDSHFLNVVLLPASVVIRDDNSVGFTLTFRSEFSENEE